MNFYKVVDHPSDIGIEASGNSLEDLFKNTAYGMMDMMFDLKGIRPEKEFTIKVSAETAESLLINWLSELLYICDSNKVAIAKVNMNRISDNELEAHVFGGKIGKLKRFIKAATYSQLVIKKDNGKYSARIVFDV